jgi:dipeptidyl aminopeptidase/acylaminoacyl peptidase
MHSKAMTAKVAPYGSWKSPITTDLITGATIGLGQIVLDGEDIYWTELRPYEKGRNVIVKRTPDGNIRDVTPQGFNVRTRVHEYGGGAYFVKNGKVYFSNFADQRLYAQTAESANAVTPEVAMRYGDGILDVQNKRIICVCEDHTAGEHEPVNKVVAISLENNQIQTLVSGNDFYASPRLSPDGSRLAWLTWNHPKMPWDSAELWVGDVQSDSSIGNTKKIAGGEPLAVDRSPGISKVAHPKGANESVCQPEWSTDGALYFILDRTGWWNIYRTEGDSIENLTPIEAEFGKPLWILGTSVYGIESPNRIICSYTQQGTWKLASLDTSSKKLETFDLPYTEISSLQVAPGKVVFNGGAPTQPTELVVFDLETLQRTVLRRASEITVDNGYLSELQGIEFPTTNGKTAYAIFYPPQNQDYTAPENEKPPLLVKSHGGPTAATSTSLSLSIQYWTSRGIAVLDVNYGGSTGYGREYRQRLEGNWG